MLNAFHGDRMRGEEIFKKLERVREGSRSGWSRRSEHEEGAGEEGDRVKLLGEVRTDAQHVREKREEKKGGGGGWGESRESGLFRGGLTSPPLLFLLLFIYLIFFQSLMSEISHHFFRDIFVWRCPCIGALPCCRCPLLLQLSLQESWWELQM